MAAPATQDKKFRWRRGNLLGQGAFCSVYLGLHLDTGELMAVKEILISEHKSRVDNVIREVRLLSKLDHPNIVKYLGTVFENNVLYVYMEYVPGGSIESLIEKFGAFPEDLTKVYARQILLGLKHLHDANIMHRDIKGANVLVSNDAQVKVSDFGASKEIEELTQGEDAMKGTLTGTPLWMAPEVVLEKGYGKPSDVFSFGATVMEMLTGKPPNSHLKNFAALVRHWDREAAVAIPGTISPVAADFLERCLRIDPLLRPTVDELLEHPFVSNVLEVVGGADMTAPAMYHVKAATVGVGATDRPDEVMFQSDPRGALGLHASAGAGPSPAGSGGDRGGAGGGGGGVGSGISGTGASVSAPSTPSGAKRGYVGPTLASVGIASFNVLVADPDARAAAATAAALTQLGCTVATVTEATEAAERIAGARPDAYDMVLVDELFPTIGDVAFVHTISGLGLALTVRVNPSFANATLLFTSPSAAVSFELPDMLVTLLGTNTVVVKPIDVGKVFDIIRRARVASAASM